MGMVDLQDRPTPRDGKILLCGQKGGDAAHSFSREQIVDWFGAVSVRLKAEHPECDVVWRPHPKEPFSLYWCDEQDPLGLPLEEALDDPDLFKVVTINSTCGVLALERGIPVECHPKSFYAHLSGHPIPRGRRQFFHRLTHCQWTLDELATAEPFLFNLPVGVAA